MTLVNNKLNYTENNVYMFSTDYYQLIFLFTFESANMVAKAKQKIGSKTTRKLRFGYLLKALRDTAILFGLRPANANGNKQNAIAA
jgi:hypothetical protein